MATASANNSPARTSTSRSGTARGKGASFSGGITLLYNGPSRASAYAGKGPRRRITILLVAIFVVLFGLAFGSFLNVCISRLPRHESIMHPGSRCPRCLAPIGAGDNVPILSWILLRGRCRHCRKPIPWRYPVVEFATAALFLLCYLRFGLTFEGIATAILCFLLLGLAVMDAETMRMPDAFTLPGVALGILYSGFYEEYPGGDVVPPPIFGKMLFAAIVAAGAALLLLLIRWLYFAIRHKEGLGMGDVKLIAMIAAWLGAAPAILTLLLGALAAAFYGIAVVTLPRGRRQLRSAPLPFGSFLCAAAIYALFAGQPMIRWYLHFYGIGN